jgi:hypothetical protein
MSVKGYKAFNKGMVCRDKQYEENTTYEENGSEICKAGVMHFCENPFDVLDYYPLIDENGNISDFTDVKAVGNVYRKDNKTATNKLHIGAKLGLKGFVKACVDFTIEKTRVEPIEDNGADDRGDYAQIGSSGDSAKIGSSGNSAQIGSSGDFAQIGSSGNFAKIGSSGDSAQIGSSGDSAQIGSSGNFAQIGSSGNLAQIGSSGNFAKIGSSGDSAKIGSSGNSAQIGSSGNSAQIGSSGDFAKITSEGKDSVVMAAGYNSIAKAKAGSWITLAEWVRTENCAWRPKCVKTEYVDGERIKEDTFYRLVDGEFKEVESEE